MQAVLWMTGSLLSFSLIAVGARELSEHIPTHESLFFRSVIGLLCLAPLLLVSKSTASIKSNKLGLHTLRNIFHFAGQYGWFLGIGLLPLAEVFALEFTVPIWTLIIASFFLGETITLRKICSILLGVAGVFVILKPGMSIVNGASLIVLASAVCYAVSHASTKSLSSSEPPIIILFYMCLIQLPIGFFLSVSNWVWPVGEQWLWLVIIGLSGLTAHYCMTKAMQYAEATTVVTLDFLRLPLIALVGVWLYAEKLDITLLAGGLLMLAGNMVNIYRQSSKNSLDAS